MVLSFSGTDCEANVDDCAQDTCYNGATCVDLVNGYVCRCAAGFTGLDCSSRSFECDGSSCLNGYCDSNPGGRSSCVCTPGYTGTWTVAVCTKQLVFQRFIILFVLFYYCYYYLLLLFYFHYFFIILFAVCNFVVVYLRAL